MIHTVSMGPDKLVLLHSVRSGDDPPFHVQGEGLKGLAITCSATAPFCL